MKITKQQLKQIIKEELTRIHEEGLSAEDLEKLRKAELGPGVATEIDDPQARYDFVVEEVKDMEAWRLKDLRDFVETQISEKEGRGPFGAVQ